MGVCLHIHPFVTRFRQADIKSHHLISYLNIQIINLRINLPENMNFHPRKLRLVLQTTVTFEVTF